MILDANYSCERLRAAAATLKELRRIVRKQIVVLIEATPPAVRKARSCPAVLPAGAPNPASADVFRGLELLCCVFLWVFSLEKRRLWESTVQPARAWREIVDRRESGF